MTTNKPEMEIYEPSEKGETAMRKASFRNTGLDRYVRLSDYEALQSECDALRKDAEFGRTVLAKREPGKTYGCHCDLEEGMEPDGCVVDSGERHNCIHAKDILAKEQCEYWRIITTDASILKG